MQSQPTAGKLTWQEALTTYSGGIFGGNEDTETPL